MRLFVCSIVDQASVAIRDALLLMAPWSEEGVFEGNPVWRCGEKMIVTIERLHLFADDVDKSVEKATGRHFDDVLFLSRHKAASGIHTLTVHPLGNFGKAELGGRDGTLVPASPHLMTSLLRRLKLEAAGLPFEVSFEVTHHGPFLETPTTFIEIGSDESMWGNRDAARAIATSIVSFEESPCPVAIGIGGGHYAPRFSEVVMSKKVSFGHMIPNYFIEKADEQAAVRYIQMAIDRTSGVRSAYIHKKSMKRSRATILRHLVEKAGLEAIDSDDLADKDA
ncbi:MAG: D-aminoacyl-tRNA deacylase [Methanomassiliicoccales archaeon]|nr:D-aminoacyl-tRNA deacylase [Methanomassiliicoccales archaeon]